LASFSTHLSVNKGNNKITELRTVLQMESQNSVGTGAGIDTSQLEDTATWGAGADMLEVTVYGPTTEVATGPKLPPKGLKSGKA
jgi:hypothetical protein